MSTFAPRMSLHAARAATTAGELTHGISQMRVQIAKPHLFGYSRRSASSYPSPPPSNRWASSSATPPPKPTSPGAPPSSNQSTPTPVPPRPVAPRPAPTPQSPQVASANKTAATRNEVSNLFESGLSDDPAKHKPAGNMDQQPAAPQEPHIDWTRSYHGLSSEPFSKEAAAVLLQETPYDDVEIKPDGIVYLPEIKYRRILNKAFGPGGWGLVPRGESLVTPKMVTREYALVAHGR